MTRPLGHSLLVLLALVGACKVEPERSGDPVPPETGGAPGPARTGGAASGGSGTGGAASASGGTSAGGAGGAATGGAGTGGAQGGSGGITATGGAAGDASAPAADALDAPRAGDRPPALDGGNPDVDSDYLPGRPDIRLCRKEWTAEQCCTFLCACLNSICADSAKAKPGLATCGTWCPKISNMARRCHVYHCYISISPTGGINDHDSHCGHAADQVAGGGCPAVVYQ